MVTSDSSEDENLDNLREAACSEFLKDSLFNTTNSNKDNFSSNSKELHPPSLRLNFNNEDQFQSLNVTPQFQQHIAKKLSGILDKKLAKILNTEAVTTELRQKHKGGIKLFSDSSKIFKFSKHNKVKNKRLVQNNSDTSDNEGKFREVAIDSDDILSQKEVKSWANRSKGEIFRYKPAVNGMLVSLD